MKQFAPGFRGGSYSESDDLNMQIEIINGQAFLDRWAGGGWKNISVHKTYDDALRARSEIAAKIRERGGGRNEQGRNYPHGEGRWNGRTGLWRFA